MISLGLWTLKLVPCGGIHEMILPLPFGSSSQSLKSSCNLTTNKNGICTGDRPRSLLLQFDDDVGAGEAAVAGEDLVLWFWLESNRGGKCCILILMLPVIVVESLVQLLFPLLLVAMGTEVVVVVVVAVADERWGCCAAICPGNCVSAGPMWERDMGRTAVLVVRREFLSLYLWNFFTRGSWGAYVRTRGMNGWKDGPQGIATAVDIN